MIKIAKAIWRAMKLHDGGMTVFVIVVIVALGGYLSKKWLGHDNPIEETAEVIIEQHTGVDVDLTPSSKER